MLKDNYKDKNKDCFCCILRSYLVENETKLMSKLKPCYEMPDEPLFHDTHIIGNDRNLYSIGVTSRVDGPFASHRDILKHYVGVKCEMDSIKRDLH